MFENSLCSQAASSDLDYFRHIIRGDALYLLSTCTDLNASALYDSYNVSNIPRPFVQEIMTHTALG